MSDQTQTPLFTAATPEQAEAAIKKTRQRREVKEIRDTKIVFVGTHYKALAEEAARAAGKRTAHYLQDLIGALAAVRYTPTRWIDFRSVGESKDTNASVAVTPYSAVRAYVEECAMHLGVAQHQDVLRGLIADYFDADEAGRAAMLATQPADKVLRDRDMQTDAYRNLEEAYKVLQVDYHEVCGLRNEGLIRIAELELEVQDLKRAAVQAQSPAPGQALMQAEDPMAHVANLLGRALMNNTPLRRSVMVQALDNLPLNRELALFAEVLTA